MCRLKVCYLLTRQRMAALIRSRRTQSTCAFVIVAVEVAPARIAIRELESLPDGRQTLPYWITEGLPVIRPQANFGGRGEPTCRYLGARTSVKCEERVAVLSLH
jgi:hypothetical protein